MHGGTGYGLTSGRVWIAVFAHYEHSGPSPSPPPRPALRYWGFGSEYGKEESRRAYDVSGGAT